MRIKLTYRHRRALRAALGTLFALQIGLTQAGMVAFRHSAAETAISTLARTLPCHNAAAMPDVTQVVIDHASAAVQGTDAGQALPHSSCCMAGDCQCASGSGACFGALPAQIMLGQAPATMIYLKVDRGGPSPDLGRELRPPISP